MIEGEGKPMNEEGLFQQRVIFLKSANEVSGWFYAMWFGSIIAFGIVALVAFSMPEIIQRVNNAEISQ